MSHSSLSNNSRRGGGSARSGARPRGGASPPRGPPRQPPVAASAAGGSRRALRAANWRSSRDEPAVVPVEASQPEVGVLAVVEEVPKQQPVVTLPFAIEARLDAYLKEQYPGFSFKSMWASRYGHPMSHADRVMATYFMYNAYPKMHEFTNVYVLDYLGNDRVLANKNFATDRITVTVGGSNSRYRTFEAMFADLGQYPAYAVSATFYSFDRSRDAWAAMRDVLEHTCSGRLLVAYTPTQFTLRGNKDHEVTGQFVRLGVVSVDVAGTKYTDTDNSWLGDRGHHDLSDERGPYFIHWATLPDVFGSFRVAEFTSQRHPLEIVDGFRITVAAPAGGADHKEFTVTDLVNPTSFGVASSGKLLGISAMLATDAFVADGIVHLDSTESGQHMTLPVELLRSLVLDAVKIKDIGADAARSRLERLASGLTKDAHEVAMAVAVARSVAAQISMRASIYSNSEESKKLYEDSLNARYSRIDVNRPCCCPKFAVARACCPTVKGFAGTSAFFSALFPYVAFTLMLFGLAYLETVGNLILYASLMPILARYGSVKWVFLALACLAILPFVFATGDSVYHGDDIPVYHVVTRDNGECRIISAMGYGRSEHYPARGTPKIGRAPDAAKTPIFPVLPPRPISNAEFLDELVAASDRDGTQLGLYGKCYCASACGVFVAYCEHVCDGRACNKTIELASGPVNAKAYCAVQNEVPVAQACSNGLLPGASIVAPTVPPRESNPNTPVCVLMGIELCTPPHVFASTPENEMRVLHARAFANKNPPIVIGVMERFTAWVKENFLQLFNLTEMYTVVADRGAWFADLIPSKAQLYASYDALSNASQVTIGLPKASFVRDGFIKVEMVMKDHYVKFGRLVQGAHASVNAIVGPWVSRFSQVLHLLWHDKYRSFFNGSVDAETEGERHDHYMEQGYVPVSGDFSNFDSSQSEPLFMVLHWCYEQFGCPADVLNILRKQVDKVGLTKCGYKYRAKGTRASGDADTLVGNGIINYLVNMFSWSEQHKGYGLANESPFNASEINACMEVYASHTDFDGDFHCETPEDYERVMAAIRDTLRKPQCATLRETFELVGKHIEYSRFPIVVEHCGDDNLTYYKPEMPINKTAGIIANLGMTNNLTYNEHPEICSSLFWPTVIDGRKASVLSAKPGRLLAKIGHITKPFGKELVSCLAGKIYGTLVDVHHVPVLSQVLAKYLELIPEGIAAKPLYHKYKAHAAAMHPVTTAGVMMFCDRYNVTVDEYDEFIASLSMIKSLPWVHRHKLFDRLYEVDNEVTFRC